MQTLGLIGVTILAILAIIFWPLLTIWALNTLFPVLAIKYGFFQWLAVVVLNIAYFGKLKYNND